ncbi:MAG: hypothetical protein ACRDOY_11770, partial [Nocardioidaceae bacterium]
VVLVAGGCVGTPDAADLVDNQTDAGVLVSKPEAAGALQDYMSVVNDALDSGDIGELDAMTGEDCPCRELVGYIHGNTYEGGQLIDASMTADEVTVVGRTGREADVSARVSVSAYAVRTADGLVVGRQPEREFAATYTVRTDGSDWQVIDVKRGS